MLLYYHLGAVINCLLILFGLVFEVNLYNFQKMWVFKIGTSIFLKYISSLVAIVFVIHEDF